MSQPVLDQLYWNERWKNGETGWDIGYVSPPLKAYMDQWSHRSSAVLIPGCGNAYEAQYLLQQGFDNVTVIDISPEAVASIQETTGDADRLHIICGDFFAHTGQYDLVLEQTFFCALDPQLRPAYAVQMSRLLKPGGKLVGLLFGREFEKDGPPFGGTKEEYENYFTPYFMLQKMEPCYNSITPRQGTELFFIATKK